MLSLLGNILKIASDSIAPVPQESDLPALSPFGLAAVI